MAFQSVKLAFLIMDDIANRGMFSFKYGSILPKNFINKGIILIGFFVFAMISIPILWLLSKEYDHWQTILLVEIVLLISFIVLNLFVWTHYKNRKRVISSLKNAAKIQGHLYTVHDKKTRIGIKFYFNDELIVKESIPAIVTRPNLKIHIFYSLSNKDVIIVEKKNQDKGIFNQGAIL